MKSLESLKAAACLLVFGLISTGLGHCSDRTSAVGPKPWGTTVAAACVGYLQVFSATEEHPYGDDTYIYPHTDYGIYNSAGKRLHWISNSGPNDEQPAKITLAQGKYVIWARSENAGMVHIPIVIKPGLETNLHLEKCNWKPARDAKVVRLPSGEVVGYAAN